VRRKLIAVALACAVVAAVVVAVVLVRSGNDDGSGTSAKSVTIRVLATVTNARQVDLPPRGSLNDGDRVFVTSTLRNAAPQFGKPTGTGVGTDNTTITYRSGTERDVSAIVTLPDGNLRLRGTIHVTSPDADVTIPIVDGTRAYENATGTAEARNAQGNQTLNVYRVELP